MTEIADAMTEEEGESLKAMQNDLSKEDEEQVATKSFQVQMEQACAKKVSSNEKIMAY